jgi:hypothetical protein
VCTSDAGAATAVQFAGRSQAPWSALLVSERKAEGGFFKCLTPPRPHAWHSGRLSAVGWRSRTFPMRWPPRARLRLVLRTDNGLKFCKRTTQTWAGARGVTWGLVEPCKPTQRPVHRYGQRPSPRRALERASVTCSRCLPAATRDMPAIVPRRMPEERIGRSTLVAYATVDGRPADGDRSSPTLNDLLLGRADVK